MKTAVDSSVLFDIVKGAPGAAAAQAALEGALSGGGLCVCAVVVAELGRYFASAGTCRTFFPTARSTTTRYRSIRRLKPPGSCGPMPPTRARANG